MPLEEQQWSFGFLLLVPWFHKEEETEGRLYGSLQLSDEESREVVLISPL